MICFARENQRSIEMLSEAFMEIKDTTYPSIEAAEIHFPLWNYTR